MWTKCPLQTLPQTTDHRPPDGLAKLASVLRELLTQALSGLRAENKRYLFNARSHTRIKTIGREEEKRMVVMSRDKRRCGFKFLNLPDSFQHALVLFGSAGDGEWGGGWHWATRTATEHC